MSAFFERKIIRKLARKLTVKKNFMIKRIFGFEKEGAKLEGVNAEINGLERSGLGLG